MSGTENGKRRYPRKIAAWPAWVKFHRSARYLKGRTANVSRGGAWIVLPVDASHEAGEPVEFIMQAPADADGGFAIQTVDGRARVVRVACGPDGGLALEFVEEKDLP